MKLASSSRAERDLDGIAEWIARDNPAHAVTYVQELRATCVKLLNYPNAFAPVPGRAKTHRRLHGSYIIYYRVTQDRVVIVAIQHGARDQSRWR